MKDVPRTQDHAPIRTIYLYTVKPEQLAFQMNTEMYKTIFNLKMRVMHHMKQSQDLIMKAETAQARPNETILTEQELQSLQQIQHIEDMLESTILRTDESLLILQSVL